MRKGTILTAALLCIAAPTHSQDRSFTETERELEHLLTLWPGEYDNREQLRFTTDDDRSAGLKRVHGVVSRVELPKLGHHVLLVEHDRDKPLSRRLLVLTADEENRAVRATQYAVNSADKPASLNAGAAALLPDCDLLFQRDVDALIGTTQSGGCARNAGVRLTADQYWFREDKKKTWLKLERARRFACMIDVPREPGGPPVKTQHYASLHDQGGSFAFVHPDGRDMVLTMRNYWSSGMRRETLVIAVQEGDMKGPTLVYAWGEPGSDRLGMNPGYLRIQCDLETNENRHLQRSLRPDS